MTVPLIADGAVPNPFSHQVLTKLDERLRANGQCVLSDFVQAAQLGHLFGEYP